MSEERQFPVLHSRVKSVPWSWVKTFETQAVHNHCGQSLEMLARRGGLDPTELNYAMRGLDPFVGTITKAQHDTYDAWLATQPWRVTA